MTTLLLALYQFALLLLTPVLALAMMLMALRSPRFRVGFRERLGFWPRVEQGGVWIHAASMGEVRAVSPLISALKASGAKLLVTSTSDTGRSEAASLLKDSGSALILPLDHPLTLLAAFRRSRPKVIVIAETEIWPGLIWLANLHSVPVIMVSARISETSLRTYRRLRLFFGGVLNLVARIQARTAEDRDRFLALGVRKERVTVGGDMKFDLPLPDGADPLAASLRRTAAGGWRVLVAGSVHPQEAGIVFTAARTLRERGVRLGLVVAPRHLEKLPLIESELRAGGGEGVRWSELKKPLEGSLLENFAAGRAIVVDRMGLLARLYGGAELAFVGGSLIPVGGHNLLEPLNWGVPVLFGPHTDNAPEIRDEVVRRGLGLPCSDGAELAEFVGYYLADEGARAKVKRGAKEFLGANRGALSQGLQAVNWAVSGPGRRGG